MVFSAESFVPPKKTGNAWASHVTGLNITGKVKFNSPVSIYLAKRSMSYPVWFMGRRTWEVRDYYTHFIHYVIQVEDVIREAFILPTCTCIAIREGFPVKVHRGILDDVIQESELLKNFRPQHILVSIFGRHDHASEPP